MERQSITFRGKIINQGRLAKIWKEINEQLSNEYETKYIRMPEIRALSMNEKRFDRALKKLMQFEHVIRQDYIEWEEPVEKASATVFYAAVLHSWTILHCKGRRPLSKDLHHELLHIWESILGLTLGTLTKKF